MLGCYYKPKELGKRAVFLNMMASVGTLVSSALAAGVYTGLNGVHGHTGWQWLYVPPSRQ